MPFPFDVFRRVVSLASWRRAHPRPAAGSDRRPGWEIELLVDFEGTRAREPGEIRHLAPLLCDERGEISSRAARLVARWLAEMRPSQLPRVDEAFRSLSFAYSHPSPWRGLSAVQLDRLLEDQERFSPLSMLASFHGNGFVRQRAVAGLSRIHDGTELPFLLIRANDWVTQVQGAAESALEDRLHPDYAPHFARNLPLVLRLRETTRRDHAELLRRVLDLVTNTEGGRYLIEGLRSPDPAVRRACFAAARAISGPDPWPFLREATSAADPMVRLAAVRAATKAPRGDVLHELLSKWLLDRFAAVRREALGLLVERFPEEADERLREFLFDSNAFVRSWARFHLHRLGVTDVAAIYRRVLEDGRRDRATTIRGLGEAGVGEDAEAISRFLDADEPSVRRAAVWAIAALDFDHHVGRLVELLGDAARSVSREARDSLRRRAVTIAPERLWSLFEGNPHPHVRLNALTVMAGLSRWESLPCLVRAGAAPEEAVAQRADIAVRKWLDDYNRRFFSRPTAAQLDRLEQAARVARDRLPAATVAGIQDVIDDVRGTPVSGP